MEIIRVCIGQVNQTFLKNDLCQENNRYHVYIHRIKRENRLTFIEKAKAFLQLIRLELPISAGINPFHPAKSHLRKRLCSGWLQL
jgi:hypothetical protein